KNPEGILTEYSLRDDDRSNTDQFTMILDTYQGQQSGMIFAVMASGVQYDAQVFIDQPDDKNWDVVWESKVLINHDGWFVEMKIPYSALRFPEKEIQSWNINFAREIRRYRTECAWHEYNPQKGPLLQQLGRLEGIENIKPPTRLSLTPYVANVLRQDYGGQSNPSSTWTNEIGGGLDLKYGINQAFTLDMTLVPDFSEVQSDNAVLNLGPFEVAFEENRPFFTEGTELFNKNNLFYSRRVGGLPIFHHKVRDQLKEGEMIKENPKVSQLINATKLTGRTKGGLGIGLFNAIEGTTEAIIEDENGETCTYQTAPATNYNMVIFDQLLANGGNAYVMNTNVWRAGDVYDANVSAGGFQLKNKAQSYSLSGFGALSQIYNVTDTDIGHAYNISLNRIAGNWTGGLRMNVESDNYEVNDMGLIFSANERTFSGNINYQDFDGFGDFATINADVSVTYSRLYRPDVFQDFGINYGTFWLMRSFNAFGLQGRYEPVDTYDYFDPRTPDFSRYLLYPRNFYIQGWISTDYRRTFAVDARIGSRWFNSNGRKTTMIEFEPRIRFSDRFNVIFGITQEILDNDRGYARNEDGAIIIGDRDRTILVNSINTRYIFNENLGVALRVRHYWSKVEYLRYYELDENSELISTSYSGIDSKGNSLDNVSQSFFNLDCVLRWRFAPGSDLLFTWKTAIDDADILVDQNYWDESRSLTRAPLRNSFTLKVLYYLDWARMVNW
ncbi:MAG: DUF5916 domain-containing protein, partial [Saprospiraceae bacterium]|nr:DUF5916 domain-containing protein [Saprospiraceae bacterium]